MKARTILSLCLISGLAAAAQTAPPSQKVAPSTTKPAVQPTSKPAAQPASKTTAQPASKPAAQAPMKTAAAATREQAAAKKPVAKTAAKATAPKRATNAAVKAPATQAKAPAKRDPFVSPVREGGPGGPDCSVGKKCLAIDAILLRGIVRAPNGAIAVVESSTRKVTYFLRENDPVFNGYVVKITADTVTFRENVVDRVGKQSTRDVNKRVSAPPV